MSRRTLSLLFGLAGLLLHGCGPMGMGGDDEYPPATHIQEVRVEPNPVPVGDKVKFTVITPDTTRTDFQYYWSVPGGEETKVPRLIWTAPGTPGEYYVRVHIGREGAYTDVQWTFKVTVIPAPAGSVM